MVAFGLSLSLAQSASAADYWPLRGSTYDPPRTRNWEGVYVGGQGAFSVAGFDFSGANGSQLDYMLRNSELEGVVSGWTTLPNGDTKGWSVGGFIGYNFQFDDVVVGVEASYSHAYDLGLSAVDSLSRDEVKPTAAPANGTQRVYNLTVGGSASAVITDIATFRGRVGWATGSWLPYFFMGGAIGRADIATTSSVSGTYRDDTYAGGVFQSSGPTLALSPLSMSEARQGVFIYGYTVGLGTEVALADNVFARAEWEWVDFRSHDIKMHTNSVRGGLGLKF